MSRIGDLIKRDGNEPVMEKGVPLASKPRAGVRESIASESADPRGALPWLEPAPDDFDDDTLGDEPLLPRKVLLIGAAVFLALLAGVIYAIYMRSGSRPGADLPVVASGAASVDDPRIPLIEAPKTAVREKPKSPGGMQVANIDKQVYDVADGQIVEEPTQMATPAEQPVVRPVPPPPSPAVSKIPDVSPLGVPPTDIRPAAKPPVTAAVKPVIKAVPVKATPGKPLPAKPVPPRIEPVVTAPATVAVSGSVYLQLGAFSTRERAESAWSQLSGKPALAGLSSNIQAASATKFRLRAGPVASREAGDAVCARLKAAGLACLIAK
jgi:cell division protein FtsN